MSNYLVKIMLVDDSRTMRGIQKKILAGIGFSNVIEAEDGDDALQKLTENTDVDLIFMDWNMPKLNGFEALKKIKTRSEIKHIPVLMVTSEAEKSKVLEAIQAGVADYVVKPFEPVLLENKVKSILGLK